MSRIDLRLEPELKLSNQFRGCWDEEKPPLRHISYSTTIIVPACTVLSGNIWQELELEPKIWTKVEPEINNFGSATLSKVNTFF